MYVNISAQKHHFRIQVPTREILLIKAAQARPFVETAQRLGVPVRSLAREAEMPFKPVLAGEGTIGEHSLWRFVELVGGRPGCEQIGYLTALDHPVTSSGKLGGMEITQAQSLRETLKLFVKEVVAESDHCDYRLTTRRGETWFSRGLVFEGHGASWFAEQYVLTFIIQIIRLCAVSDWLPRRIRIATLNKPVELPPEWNMIQVEWGSGRTELLIEKELLDLPPRNDAQSASIEKERNPVQIEDLVDRQIWSRQHGLENAANELGMSSATLKRRLSDLGTSYSNLLLRRRLHHANRLLKETDMSVGKIAQALGYSSVHSFSRAFRKATGSPPVSQR